MPNGTFKFTPKHYGEIKYKLIVVDEISMLPRTMWHTLLFHRIHVLALGDPFQIPPVVPNENNHVLDKPHVFLDQIMRQAAESEIIRLSMHIRDGRALSTFEASGREVLVYQRKDLVEGMYTWGDQIICGTNKVRTALNNEIRKLKGFGSIPEVGDKIISLHNQWEFYSSNNLDPQPLTNGTIGTIQNMQLNKLWLPPWIHPDPVDTLYTSMIDEDTDNIFNGIPIDYKTLIEGEKSLTPEEEYMIRKEKQLVPFEFAYAYAITCHKAQGSQWDKVLVYEEPYPTDRREHARWLYTAATRASEKLVVIRKE